MSSPCGNAQLIIIRSSCGLVDLCSGSCNGHVDYPPTTLAYEKLVCVSPCQKVESRETGVDVHYDSQKMARILSQVKHHKKTLPRRPIYSTGSTNISSI